MDNLSNYFKHRKFFIQTSPLLILFIIFLFVFSEGNIPMLFLGVLLIPVFVFIRFNEADKFNYEFTHDGILIHQFWEIPFTVPYTSIIKVYLRKTPFDKISKTTDLVIEFGEKHSFKDRILNWLGPRSVLNSFYSPGIWGNYCAITDIDDSKAEELKDKILAHTNNVEVKRIGLFYL